jgi:site-specific recombinase XerC
LPSCPADDGRVSRAAAKRDGQDELLRESEVQRLLLAASARAPTGVRNRALIALVYCSGLRVAEALALRAADLDLAAATVAVGGTRRRSAHLFPAAAPYLETWLGLREQLDLPARATLLHAGG